MIFQAACRQNRGKKALIFCILFLSGQLTVQIGKSSRQGAAWRRASQAILVPVGFGPFWPDAALRADRG